MHCGLLWRGRESPNLLYLSALQTGSKQITPYFHYILFSFCRSWHSPALTGLIKVYECYSEFIDFDLFGCVNLLLLKQGKCMKQVQDVIERLWDFIDKLDINTFGKLVTIGCFQILTNIAMWNTVNHFQRHFENESWYLFLIGWWLS